MKIFIAVLFMLASAVLSGASVATAQELQEELNLSKVLAEALKSNPEIQAVRQKVESARARAGQSTYLEDPEVNIEAWGVPLNHPVRFRSSNPIILGLRQKFPFFGKLGLKGEIAAEEVKMAGEELRAKEVEVIAKVKSAYADFFMASKSIEIQKELLELVRQASLTADNLYRVGKAPQQDVIKALLEQTDALNKLNWAERDRITSQAKLNTLLSRSPSSPLGQLSELKLTPLSLQFSDLEKLVLEQRPELRALESGINKSEKSLELARKNQKVQVNFMTLLDAQRTIRDTRMGYYKALVDYEQSLADLDRAVGVDLTQLGKNKN